MKFGNVGRVITTPRKSTRKIKSIAVHCLYTPPDMDVGAKDVHQWHKERGWSGIGYHFVIRRDGTIEQGRDIDYPGAHVKGHNKYTIGVAYAGGAIRQGGKLIPAYDQETHAQRKALIYLTHKLADIHGLKYSKIKGHNEYPDVHKSCPNLTMSLIRKGVDIKPMQSPDKKRYHFWDTSEHNLLETKNRKWIDLMHRTISVSKVPFAINKRGVPVCDPDHPGTERQILEAITKAML